MYGLPFRTYPRYTKLVDRQPISLDPQRFDPLYDILDSVRTVLQEH